MIYLDHAATTPLLPSVRSAMHKAEKKFFANASALHTPGHLAMNEIENTRYRLAQLIHAQPEEIFFTSGSSESNNTIINIFAHQPIAASVIEHHSILEPLRTLSSCPIPIPIDNNGIVCYNEKIWDLKPRLISICLANNELGVIEPLTDWTKIAHNHHAFVHSDLTQALGKIDLDMQKLGLDYATFSAHKIGGPIGVGALYVKKTAPFQPLIRGGNQEQKRRGGTYNTIGIIGFGTALSHIKTINSTQIFATKIKQLRDNLAQHILTKIPGASINTPLNQLNLPNILNVSFSAAEGESIQLYLDAVGIVVSTGSACASGDLEPSHILMAKTGDAEVAHSSIRFSFGLENTEHDVDQVMSSLPQIIHHLQQISTIKMKGTHETV